MTIPRTKDLPILWKVTSAAALCLMLVIGIIAVDGLVAREQNRVLNQWEQTEIQVVNAALDLPNALSGMQTALHHLTFDDAAGIPALNAREAQTKPLRDALATDREQALRLIAEISEAEPETGQRLLRIFNGYSDEIALIQTEQNQTLKTAAFHRATGLYSSLREVTSDFASVRRDALLREMHRLRSDAHMVLLGLLGLLMLVGALVATLLIGTAYRINATVRKIMKTTNDLADGTADPETLDLGLDLTRGDEVGQIGRSLSRLIEVLREVTAARDALRRLSISDPLTELPNRRGLDEQLEEWLQGPEALPVLTAMHIDLDHFKVVNDTMGHDAGDFVLQTAAKRMQHAVRESDVVARVGGDEFVVLLPELDDLGRLAQIAMRIIASLSEPITFDQRPCQIGASIGIAIGGFYHGIEQPEQLLKDADLAVFKSKANGRGKFSVFDKNMRALIEHQRAMAERLTAALEDNHIEAWLQPVMDPAGERLLSVEALARWRDPTLGLISAEDFIEIATQRNLITDIGTVVIARASRAAARWIAKGHDIPQLSFNLSGVELKSPAIVDEIKWALEHAEMPPERVALEINAKLPQERGGEVALASIGRLRAMGITIVVDDLDVDNPTPSELETLGAGIVKLDRKLADSLIDDPKQEARIARLVDSLSSMQLTVYGKGISDQVLAEKLLAAGCSGLQGRLIAAPMPFEDFEAWLVERDRGQLREGAA
ncbi:MAG: EAL domain-containing protein [Pseudomonadota bacterium]